MSDRQSVPLKLMHLESRESKKTWRKTPQHAASSQSQTPRRILLACWDVSLGGMSQIPPRPPLAPWLGSLSCDLSEWRSRWAVCISHRHASGGLRSVAAATEQVIDPQSLPGCGGGGAMPVGGTQPSRWDAAFAIRPRYSLAGRFSLSSALQAQS